MLMQHFHAHLATGPEKYEEACHVEHMLIELPLSMPFHASSCLPGPQGICTFPLGTQECHQKKQAIE